MSRTPSILVVDNYDSFTFNLVHALEAVSASAVEVIRCDDVTPDMLGAYDAAVFSPGPGLPGESARLMALTAAALSGGNPLLGVCLGHQALAVSTGARLKNLTQVHHGVSPQLDISEQSGIFEGLSAKITAGRYHSWVVDEATLPAAWTVTCRDSAGEVMAMRHASLPAVGIQFHPESIMTPDGRRLLSNFLRMIAA